MLGNFTQRFLYAAGLAVFILSVTLTFAAAPADAKAILDTAGVKGGLIVHLGCGDGKLTAALHAGDMYRVHGLDRDGGNVEKARGHVQSLGLYGPVSIDRLSGNMLPCADNLVNLIVAEKPGEISTEEMMRVLVPNGVAYVRKDGSWTKTVKPWPPEIDEWTHFLHGADNNAVANDTIVGLPKRMQWVGSPTWSRNHTVPSVSVVVSAAGRLFSVVDEGGPIDAPRGKGGKKAVVTQQWNLIARDAFNGIVL